MPINAHPDFIAAEKEYLIAQTLEEKIEKLRKMISHAPSHKGGENLRAQLTSRLKRLLEQQEKQKKSGKSLQKGIRKEDAQAVLIGKTNSGKSSIMSVLTNNSPTISEFKYTTTRPEIGIMNYERIPIQIIEVPPIDSEYYNKGIVYNTDTALLVVEKLEDILEIEKNLKTIGKKIIVFTKADKLSEEEKRKLKATLKSKFKSYEFAIISSKTSEGIEELKEKIFKSFGIIRVFTKEPGKEKSKKPIILKPGSTLKEVAEKIFKGFSKNVKESKIWGPSSKFPGQKIGLNHVLKDLDVVEFRTK